MGSRAAALVCCLLVVAVPLVGPVAAATQSPAGPAGGDGDANRCFPGEGYEFTIGTQGPQIGMVLHLSMLTNLGGPGAVGIELSGSIDGPPIIELKTGVVFEGIDDIGSFLNDPFEPFAIAFDYRFELPMFGPSYDYEDSDAPIEGPIGDANCTVTE